jgi:hypothetical protein
MGWVEHGGMSGETKPPINSMESLENDISSMSPWHINNILNPCLFNRVCVMFPPISSFDSSHLSQGKATPSNFQTKPFGATVSGTWTEAEPLLVCRRSAGVRLRGSRHSIVAVRLLSW